MGTAIYYFHTNVKIIYKNKNYIQADLLTSLINEGEFGHVACTGKGVVDTFLNGCVKMDFCLFASNIDMMMKYLLNIAIKCFKLYWKNI